MIHLDKGEQAVLAHQGIISKGVEFPDRRSMKYYKDGREFTLPADPYSQQHYKRLGFTLTPPPTPETDGETSVASERNPPPVAKPRKRRTKKRLIK